MSKPNFIAMIPARMGSQRLPKKNLRELAGIPLITRTIRKCKNARAFDEIWVNSEDTVFARFAEEESVLFHHRPKHLGDNQATSEQFIAEFLSKTQCNVVFQVHSIAPLLTVADISAFVEAFDQGNHDCLLSTESIQIECLWEGRPVNFSFREKTNSQELEPVQRVSWSITAWRRESFLDAVASGKCATYSGNVGTHSISKFAAHVIKTEEDLILAEALLPLVERNQ